MKMTHEPPSNCRAEPAAGWRVLEPGRRLSASLLWRLQRRFFAERGAAAWSTGTVPSYITSNGWIANAYARVVLGWLRDAAAGQLDPGQPVHIVELGCGSGRFGYLFLHRLLDLVRRTPLRDVRIRYVFTDFTESNLAALRDHPSLRPFLEQGLVDFALYDAGADLEIRLERSGEALTPQTLRNPLVVLANYVFDGIPQDAFTVRGGRLFETLVTASAPETAPGLTDPNDPALLPYLRLDWEEIPATASPYGNPALDRILEGYLASDPITDGTTLLFPVAALRCAGNLARLSGGRLLLLSGDKGYSREEQLAGRGRPELAVHGSFSLMVNHHALGQWFLGEGGGFLRTTHLHSSLDIVAGLLGCEGGAQGVETALAFDEAIERMGPDDFFQLKKIMDDRSASLSLEQLLAWLRLSGWDANILLRCFPALMKHAGSAPDLLRHEIYLAVHEVWRLYFPIGEARDLAFHLGVLLCEIGCFDDALELFRASRKLYGPNPATDFNIALCHFNRGDLEAARTAAEQSIAASPGFDPAATLLTEIRAQLPG